MPRNLLLILATASIAILMSYILSTARTTARQSTRNIIRTSKPSTRNMHVKSIPMWRGTGNNYAYLVTDTPSNESVIIDPANPPEVIPHLKPIASSLKAIINTHHHHDHAGGNKQILEAFPGLPIIGGKDCDLKTETPTHGSTFKIGKDIEVTALHTPCHTQDSICYHMRDTSSGENVVFTGDTLFIGGCGRFFEGTPQEMDTALNKVLAKLPDDTKVYPGHEYTKGNAKFGVTVSSADAVRNLAEFCEKEQETQGKFTIGDEKKHNVFMMLEDEEIVRKTGVSGRVEVMGKLRELKNSM